MSGGRQHAAPDSPRFLRVVTFNLWNGNSHMDEVAKFLAATDADVVVLQEAPREHAAALRQALQSRYPFAVGDAGIVMLSKYPILAEGRIDRPGYPPWISLMLRWAKLEVNGTTFELAGVHLTRPFYPELQQQDIAALISFAGSRSLPLVMAGDFNMSPWTEKLQRFERSSGLSALQHLRPHLADGTGRRAPPAFRGDRQCVRLAVLRQDLRNRRTAARVRSPADHRRSGVGQAWQTMMAHLPSSVRA